jgi:hypothetical protein
LARDLDQLALRTDENITLAYDLLSEEDQKLQKLVEYLQKTEIPSQLTLVYGNLTEQSQQQQRRWEEAETRFSEGEKTFLYFKGNQTEANQMFAKTLEEQHHNLSQQLGQANSLFEQRSAALTDQLVNQNNTMMTALQHTTESLQNDLSTMNSSIHNYLQMSFDEIIALEEDFQVELVRNASLYQRSLDASFQLFNFSVTAQMTSFTSNLTTYIGFYEDRNRLLVEKFSKIRNLLSEASSPYRIVTEGALSDDLITFYMTVSKIKEELGDKQDEASR